MVPKLSTPFMNSGDQHISDVVLTEVTRDVASGAVGDDSILRSIPSEEELCLDCHSRNDQQGLQVEKALETTLVQIENQPTRDTLNGLSEETNIAINVPSAGLESVVLHRAILKSLRV